jgi:hypothetical protein
MKIWVNVPGQLENFCRADESGGYREIDAL